jgi:hypothetical protein
MWLLNDIPGRYASGSALRRRRSYGSDEKHGLLLILAADLDLDFPLPINDMLTPSSPARCID